MKSWLRRLTSVLALTIALSIVFVGLPDALAIYASSNSLALRVDNVPVQSAHLASRLAPIAGPSDPRGEPLAIAPQAIEAGSGYCASTGGSSQYESITDATFTQSPGGTWQLQVQVFIANPNGCVSGESCPSYDPSPENVNAWIDWNGDKTWEPSEQVMNSALTGYLGINYQGTMTAIAQFSQPAIITDTTWARVNLGWGVDPNDPCTPSWTWGNVVDKELNIGGPKIKEIKVTGSKDAANPMTTYDVKLEAIMKTPPDYEITKVSWSGDLKVGDGNPYTYKPDKNTHGLKKIKATATYRHIPSGATGQVAKEFEFKLFFEKKGDDDGDSEPNWFDYWGNDGAVAGLKNAIVKFDATKGAGQYGSWNPATDKVDLGAAAAETHYPGGLTIDGTTYGNVKGIDSVSEVIGHELRHRTTNHNWKAGGIWVSKTDTDNGVPDANYWDKLPDEYEDTFGTDKTKTDSKDLEHKKSAVYKFYGDNEFDAIVAGHGFRGIANKDWANPGSQSNPAFKTLLSMAAALETVATLAATSGPSTQTPAQLPNEVVLPGLAQLTGHYTDAALDANDDNINEALRIVVEVNVTEPSQYVVIGWIKNGGGQDVAWAQRTTYLNAGIQQVNLDFDGKLLYKEGANSAFLLARVDLRMGEHSDLVDFGENAYTTAAYALGNFTPPAVTFTGSYADAGEDTGSDGLFDRLNIDVGVTIRQPGNYTLVGWLRDAAGNPIPGASASVAFNTSGVKRLAFDGQSIRWHRQNGPYTLQLVEVRDALDARVAKVVDAYATTTPYTANQFGLASAATLVTNSFADFGKDVNGDALFDYLAVHVDIEAVAGGSYQLLATLRSQEREYLADVDLPLVLASGTNSVTVDFPGGLIRLLQANGPYQVEAVALVDEGGATIDYQAVATTTQAYSYTAFALPLVQLTDTYRDYPADTVDDSAADVLKIDVGLLPGNNGAVIAQGQLTDSAGEEIAWVNGSVAVTASVPATVTLVFSASDIQAHGVDGPYLLRNLLLYHTGDPNQDVTVADAYITAPYDRNTLQPKVVIGPPATVTVDVQPATLPADGTSIANVLVTVEDASGNAIPNQTVQVVATKGYVSSSSGKTGINGTIAMSLTASTLSGEGTITATAGGVSGSDNITFVPGAPAELTLLVNPTQVNADGTSPIAVSAVVRDEFGNMVSGQQVNFSVTAGTIGATAQTNSNGVAVTQLVAPATRGVANVSASIGGIVENAQVQFVGNPQIFLPRLRR